MAYDVILLCGQSNAEGNGLGETEFPYVPDEKIMMMRDSGWYGYKKQPDGKDKLFLTEPYNFITEVANERFVGEKYYGMFVLSFCKKYVESGLLENGRKLLIINASIGGTGFARKEWGVGNLLHNRLFTMFDEAKLGEDDKIVAFLWHQGEHDAFENAHFSPKERYDFYYSSLFDMISDIRDRCGNGLPFIAGEFCHEWWDANTETCNAVLSAMKDVCCALPCAALVSSDALKSNNQSIGNGDDIHFCRDSLMTLGQRYFDAFVKIRGTRYE